MSKSTVMSIKTDKRIKEEAQKIAKNMGFPLGTLINAFLIQLVRNKTIYFTLDKNKIMTKALETELARIEKDMKAGKNLSPRFEKMEKAIQYLKKR